MNGFILNTEIIEQRDGLLDRKEGNLTDTQTGNRIIKVQEFDRLTEKRIVRQTAIKSMLVCKNQ